MLFIIYFVSLIFTWYENYCIVMFVYDSPQIFSNYSSRLVFRTIRRIMVYGSIFGIGYVFGVKSAFVFFIIYLVLNGITLQKYYNREVRNFAYEYIEGEKNKYNDNEIEVQNLKKEAFEIANSAVTDNLQSKGVKTLLKSCRH